MKKIFLTLLLILAILFFALVLGNRYLIKPKIGDTAPISSDVSIPVEIEKSQEAIELPREEIIEKDTAPKLPEKVLLDVLLKLSEKFCTTKICLGKNW